MIVALHPDPAPGSVVPAHVTVSYNVVLKDVLGRKWLCHYNVRDSEPRRCALLRERPH